jgi:hypothetical protein
VWSRYYYYLTVVKFEGVCPLAGAKHVVSNRNVQVGSDQRIIKLNSSEVVLLQIVFLVIPFDLQLECHLVFAFESWQESCRHVLVFAH